MKIIGTTPSSVYSEGAKKPPSVKERSNRHRMVSLRAFLPWISISHQPVVVNIENKY